MNKKIRRECILIALAVGGACLGCDPDTGRRGNDSECANDRDCDGVGDAVDVCPGHDDRLDADGDSVPDGCDVPGDWVTTATIGGLGLYWQISDPEIITRLDELKAQNVTVVEADSELSNYMDDLTFEQEMDLVTRTVELAHERGLKLVWYYPALELITKEGRILDHSMARDHPDWLQLNIDGTPNVFYGDLVFWTDPDDESAWLDPLTGFRAYFLDRIRGLAETGIDGIWLDVPLYSNIVGIWPSHTPESRGRFLQDTGLEIPADKDPSDPVWWEWMQWRHLIIAEFLEDMHLAAREVNPGIWTFVENVTLDHNGALVEGLDAAYMPDLDGFTHVWEIGMTSTSDAMIFAGTEDWISLIAMFEFGRGVFPDRPSWTFVFGNQVDDAELVMAEALAAQHNPYELKAPEMTTTVDPAYRQRMFGWIQEHHEDLFLSESAARVVVLHSSSSRDFIDGTCLLEARCGVSTYASTDRPAGLREEADWWSGYEPDSAHASSYMADYRGMIKALVHLHQPFDVMPLRRATAELLGRYPLVILPDPQAVSDEERDVITEYVEAGGHVLITGPDPGARTSTGVLRPYGAFASLVDSDIPLDTCSVRIHDEGVVTYCTARQGKRYFDLDDVSALAIVKQVIDGADAAPISTDAPPNLHFQLYRRGHRRILHIVNFTGVGDEEIPDLGDPVTIEPHGFHLRLDVGNMPEVSRVVASSSRAGSRELPFRFEDGTLEVDVEVEAHLVLFVEP